MSLKFREVLVHAIADFAINGYDSEIKLENWLNALRVAAKKNTKTAIQIDLETKKRLTTVFESTLKKQPIHVKRFTVDKLTPTMRQELDRRIKTSADLIKLNRDQMIDRTMSRFHGWATSIPPGGSNVEKIKTRMHIAKPLDRLSYEERRVMIDQGHKMAANINYSIAAHSGAIAVIWHSHWQQANYNYREDHKDRDKKIFALRGCWAIEDGFMKSGENGYLDSITLFGEEVNCRCYGQYIYSLSDIPTKMLTEKGKKFLNAD